MSCFLQFWEKLGTLYIALIGSANILHLNSVCQNNYTYVFLNNMYRSNEEKIIILSGKTYVKISNIYL